MMKNKYIKKLGCFVLIILTTKIFANNQLIKFKNNQLSNLLINIKYCGDVENILQQLKKIDPDIKILPSLGNYGLYNININLNNLTLSDLNSFIKNQTNNQVELIYNSKEDSVRLYYTNKNIATDAVEQSLKWQHGSDPSPVIQSDGVVRFPYGQYEPIIICEAYNLCDIELQAGEEIHSIVIGDSLRWNNGDQGIPTVYSGSGKNIIPHIILKATKDGLETTLLITTNKRTYMIKIKSSINNYVLRAGFYYPVEILQNLKQSNTDTLTQSTTNEKIDHNELKMYLVDLAKLSYHYKLSDENYAWKPVQIFDDGISVFIQLPNDIDSKSLPTLCVYPDADDSGKTCELVNFRYKDHFYIIDKLFTKAKLYIGFGDKTEDVFITLKKKNTGLLTKIFGS